MGCVLGDWIIKNHSFEKVSEIEEIADELWFDGEIFGSLDTVSMFGSSLDGTYQQRLTRLEAHIQALHEKAASLVGVAA